MCCTICTVLYVLYVHPHAPHADEFLFDRTVRRALAYGNRWLKVLLLLILVRDPLKLAIAIGHSPACHGAKGAHVVVTEYASNRRKCRHFLLATLANKSCTIPGQPAFSFVHRVGEQNGHGVPFFPAFVCFFKFGQIWCLDYSIMLICSGMRVKGLGFMSTAVDHTGFCHSHSGTHGCPEQESRWSPALLLR